MRKIKLSKYLARSGLTQTDLARAVGLTQGAISQMVIRDRPVYVLEEDGRLVLEEIKVRRFSL